MASLSYFLKFFREKEKISYLELDSDYYNIASVLHDLGFLTLHQPSPNMHDWFFTWRSPVKLDRHTEIEYTENSTNKLQDRIGRANHSG